MSRLDRAREEIGWLKLAFGILAAIDASLIAWLARNHTVAEQWMIVAGVLGVVVVSSLIVLVNVMAIHRFRRLEKL